MGAWAVNRCRKALSVRWVLLIVHLKWGPSRVVRAEWSTESSVGEMGSGVDAIGGVDTGNDSGFMHGLSGRLHDFGRVLDGWPHFV